MPVGTTNTVVKRSQLSCVRGRKSKIERDRAGWSCARPARTPISQSMWPSPVRVAAKRSGMASAERFSPRWVVMYDRSRSLGLAGGSVSAPHRVRIDQSLLVVAARRDVIDRAVAVHLIDAGEVLEARGPAQHNGPVTSFEIDVRQGLAVEHVRLDQGISTHGREQDARANRERFGEAVGAEQIAGEACAAGEHVTKAFARREIVAVAKDIGLDCREGRSTRTPRACG